VRPAWSPDGARIVFTRIDASNASDLWTIRADGSEEQQLTFGAHALEADWGTSQLVPNDLESPIIDIRSPVNGTLYWAGSSQTAFYSCSGQVAQLLSCIGDVPHGSSLDLSTPGVHTFTVRAVDSLGNSATKTVTYEVVGVDLRTPADGATYELGADLSIDYSCDDPGGSGLVRCEGNLPDGAPLDTSVAGTHRFSVVAFGNAGAVGIEIATYTVVDRRPPRIDIQSPFAGFTYPIDTAASADYRCSSPGGVWIVSCVGTVPSGDRIPAASVGPHTFTVTATDANGKTTTSSVPYVVVYSFTGFDSPVDASGTVSDAKAGDGIALKFSLSGNQGLNVIAQRTWQPASCADWTLNGSPASADGKLSYSSSTDRYRDVVTTSSSWKGTCRILLLDFEDSITREVRVLFQN
jgi:hypothetical protein